MYVTYCQKIQFLIILAATRCRSTSGKQENEDESEDIDYEEDESGEDEQEEENQPKTHSVPICKKKQNNSPKWIFLEHRGPLFPPDYEPLPADVHFIYDGRPMKLSLASEEVACFYGQMLKHDYTSKSTFNKNFFEDWCTVSKLIFYKLIIAESLTIIRRIANNSFC